MSRLSGQVLQNKLL